MYGYIDEREYRDVQRRASTNQRIAINLMKKWDSLGKPLGKLSKAENEQFWKEVRQHPDYISH